jgi:hypothetical protein
MLCPLYRQCTNYLCLASAKRPHPLLSAERAHHSDITKNITNFGWLLVIKRLIYENTWGGAREHTKTTNQQRTKWEAHVDRGSARLLVTLWKSHDGSMPLTWPEAPRAWICCSTLQILCTLCTIGLCTSLQTIIQMPGAKRSK